MAEKKRYPTSRPRKMRARFMAFLLAMGLASYASAAQIELSWNGNANAIAYRLYHSLDQGQTWTPLGADIPQPDPFVPDVEIGTEVDVPETGLVLIRVSSVGTNGEAVRQEAGAFYNHLWTAGVGGLGVK